MTDDKPLHVQVAEALGWTEIHEAGTPGCCGDILLPGVRWNGRAPGNMLVGHIGHHDRVPDFSTDWSATGPLIVQYALDLSDHRKSPVGGRENDPTAWMATAWRPDHDPEEVFHGKGRTPLIAICNLIVELSALGKLDRPPRTP